MRKYRAVAVILCCVLNIVMIESIMRIYNYVKLTTDKIILSSNPELIYEHKPLISFTNRYGVKISYNSMGFRGQEISEDKQGAVRILGIGDSITEAVYLSENHGFVNMVAEILRNRFNRNIEAINAAVGGYNSWQEFAMIQSRGLLVRPDLIIVGICMNDFDVNRSALKKAGFGRIGENLRDGSKARYFNFLYQTSDLYKFGYDLLSGLKRNSASSYSFASYAKNYKLSIDQETFENWKKPLLKMLDVAKQYQIQIIFVIFPLQGQVLNGEIFTSKSLSDFFEQNKAYYVDLIKPFSEEMRMGSKEQLYLRKDIIHPNKRGHQIAAYKISEYIITNKILK